MATPSYQTMGPHFASQTAPNLRPCPYPHWPWRAATHAKLHIRGHGSGHLEVDGRTEARVPLMVAVTSLKVDPEGFPRAIALTLERLIEVAAHYKIFCSQRGLIHADLIHDYGNSGTVPDFHCNGFQYMPYTALYGGDFYSNPMVYIAGYLGGFAPYPYEQLATPATPATPQRTAGVSAPPSQRTTPRP